MTFRKLVLYVFLPLFLAVILLTIGSILAAMLLDESPITAQIPSSLDFTPMMTGMRTVNQSLYSALSQPPGKEQILELTEREFNALIAGSVNNPFAASLINVRLPDELKNGRLELESGVFTLLYPYDIQMDTPFGRFINIRCKFQLEIQRGVPVIRILSCKAGAFSIPGSKVQKTVEQKMEERYFGKSADKIIREGVVSLKMINEKAILRYRPYELIETADRIYNPDGSRRIRQTIRRMVR